MCGVGEAGEGKRAARAEGEISELLLPPLPPLLPPLPPLLLSPPSLPSPSPLPALPLLVPLQLPLLRLRLRLLPSLLLLLLLLLLPILPRLRVDLCRRRCTHAVIVRQKAA